MSSIEGVDISNTSNNNPVVNNLIAEKISKGYNKRNSNCETAFNNYNNSLPQMNTLSKQFVNSKTIEGFNSTQDDMLTNQEIINAISTRSDDIADYLNATTLAETNISNTIYKNNIDLLEKKKQAINASSQSLNDYYKYAGNEFNKNFNKEQDLKNKIMTSDRIIHIQEEEYENKVFYSSLFAYLLVYLIAVGILYKVRKPLGISFSVFMGLLVSFTVILILMVTRRWLQKNAVMWKIEHSIEKAVKDLKNDTLANFIDDLLGPCPDKCQDGSKPQTSGTPASITPSADTTGLQMRTDLTTDVWINGDQTGSVGIQPAYPGLPNSLVNVPEKNDDGSPVLDSAGNPVMVKNPLIEYTCYWNGGQNSGINPKTSELKTTVPCEYLPGYSYVNTGLENNSSKYDNN